MGNHTDEKNENEKCPYRKFNYFAEVVEDFSKLYSDLWIRPLHSNIKLSIFLTVISETYMQYFLETKMCW